MQHDDVQALAGRAREGDTVAFARLCDAFVNDVWRYCMALLGDREQAYDAAQDTFLRLVPAIRRYRGDSSIRVYIMVLARRAAADLIRVRQRERTRMAGHEPPEKTSQAHTGSVEVVELVAGLSDRLREAFVLTRVLGFTYEEAAAAAEVPVGTIRSRVARAREQLVTALEQAERS